MEAKIFVGFGKIHTKFLCSTNSSANINSALLTLTAMIFYRLLAVGAATICMTSCGVNEVGIENLQVEKNAVFYVQTSGSWTSSIKTELEKKITADKYFRLGTAEKHDFTVEIKDSDTTIGDDVGNAIGELVGGLILHVLTLGLFVDDSSTEEGIVRCTVRDKNNEVRYKKDFLAYTYEYRYADSDDKDKPWVRQQIDRENEARRERAKESAPASIAEKIYNLLKNKEDLRR